MQRIKLNVFKSWFDKNLTGKEIDFLLVLSFYQDKRGVTRGVYYKDMMREGKMSAQTFYDCKKSLTEKGVISSVEGQDDYDITLIGNDFTIYEKEDYEEGKVKYLSTTYHLFRDPYFRTLKPKQKLLVMDLLNIQMAGRPNGVNTYRIYRENFIKKYANIKQNDGTKSKGLLDITVRTLQKYFKLLKHYFSVSLKRERTETSCSILFSSLSEYIYYLYNVRAAKIRAAGCPRRGRRSAWPHPRGWTAPRRCGTCRSSAYRAGSGRCRRPWSAAARRSAASCGTEAWRALRSRRASAGGRGFLHRRGCPSRKFQMRTPEPGSTSEYRR